MTSIGLGNLESFADHVERLVNRRQRGFGELHVNRGSRDLYNFSSILCHKSFFAGARPRLPCGGRTADNFNNFLGDLCLADAVHGQRQSVNHVGGVVGSRIHGRHAGSMLGRL